MRKFKAIFKRIYLWWYRLITSFKLGPFGQTIKALSSLGVITIIFLMGFSAYQAKKIRDIKATSETLENGNLNIVIIYPEYVAYGETGKIEILIKNIGEDTYRDVRIAVVDGKDIWFADGNEASFAEIKRGSQMHKSLNYTITMEKDQNINFLNLRVFVEYNIGNINQLNPPSVPLSKTAELTNSPRVYISPFKQLFISLKKAESGPDNSLSNISSFLGVIISMTAAIIALEANFRQIWSFIKSKRQESGTTTN